MVLTRAFACATPVVASDIPGYRDVMTPETAVAVPPDDPARARGRRSRPCSRTSRGAQRSASAARAAASERYAWADVARRLEAIYELGSWRATQAGRGVKPASPRSPWLRAALVPPLVAAPSSCSGGAGPTGRSSATPSISSTGRGSSSRSALNLVVGARPLARLAADDRPGARPAAPALRPRLLGVRRSACSRTRCCRAGSGSSPASPSCAGTCPHGRGTSATLVGTVFAHRLFDLVPARAPRRSTCSRRRRSRTGR